MIQKNIQMFINILCQQGSSQPFPYDGLDDSEISRVSYQSVVALNGIDNFMPFKVLFFLELLSKQRLSSILMMRLTFLFLPLTLSETQRVTPLILEPRVPRYRTQG